MMIKRNLIQEKKNWNRFLIALCCQFFVTCLISQNNSNYLFIASKYNCVCESDSNSNYELSVEKEAIETKTNKYLIFSFKNSKDGTIEKISVSKKNGSYFLIQFSGDSVKESPLFTFNEKLGKYNHYDSVPFLASASTFHGKVKLPLEHDSLYYYHLEGETTHSSFFYAIYFDLDKNVHSFGYYDGSRPYSCNSVVKKRKKRKCKK